MNFSVSLARTRFSNGAAKVRIIFKLPNLFEKIFKFFLSAPVFHQNSQPYQPPVFQRECKGTTFFVTSKLFREKIQKKCNFPQNASNTAPKEHYNGIFDDDSGFLLSLYVQYLYNI